MHGDTYTPESSSPSQSPTPERSPSPQPGKPTQNGFANGTTNGESKNSAQASMIPNGSRTPVKKIRNQNFFGHEREQVTRILIQGLEDLGYTSAAQTLTQESGFELESSNASAFRSAVLAGAWDEAEALLFGESPEARRHNDAQEELNTIVDGHISRLGANALSLSAGADRGEMLFLIRQQKYLELLEQRKVAEALNCLRQELHPLHQDQKQLHALSSLIMCQSPEEVKIQATWDGAAGASRKTLLANLSSAISPTVMIPEHRLAHLLDQWKGYQLQNCQYHSAAEPPSLYTEHACSRDDFPLDVLVELDHHTNEVWFVKFSNNGRYLATAGQDKLVIIYDTTTFNRKHVLTDHRNGVVSVAWSPDDKTLISCSRDQEARLWDTSAGRCVRVIKTHEEPVTSAAWAPDGQSFALGSMDVKKPLSIWPIDPATSGTTPLHTFEGSCNRVQDCAVAAVRPTSPFEPYDASHSDSNALPIRLAVLCIDHTVHVFDYTTHEKLRQISVGHVLTCISLSNDGHEMLVNLSCNEIWALNVEDGEVRQKYFGQQQGKFVIRSCYGGANEGIVASGGEDGNISIWHRHSGRLLERIDGHAPACVNTVSWNAANPRMFASAGDDSKVRVWAPTKTEVALPEALAAGGQVEELQSNGEEANGYSVPRWGSTSSGGPVSGLGQLLRR